MVEPPFCNIADLSVIVRTLSRVEPRAIYLLLQYNFPILFQAAILPAFQGR